MRSVFLLAALIISMSCFGQAGTIGFGPEVGLNISNYSIKSGGASQKTDVKYGGMFGGIVEIDLDSNFYIQPGLFFFANGYKQNIVGGTAATTINTIEIPVYVGYKFGPVGTRGLFINVGPYVGFNKGGFTKFRGTFKYTRDLHIGSDSTDNVKILDLGAAANVGYQLMEGFFFSAHYQMGFMNVLPHGNSDNYLRNYNFGISIGYMFDAKKVKKAVDK